MAPLALVPLLAVLPSVGRGGAWFGGWTAGALSLGVIFHWLVPTAINLAGFPDWGAVLVLVAYSLVFGLDFAVLAFVCREVLLLRVAAWARMLLVAAAVVATDFGLPHLFPFTLGNTFWRHPTLLQGAEWTGIEGATFVTVALSAALALALRDLWQRRRPTLVPLAVSLILVATWVGYGMFRLPQVRELEASAPTLKLLLVQPDIRPHERRSRDPVVRDGMLGRLLSMTLGADLTAVDAIVWPEGAAPYEWPSAIVKGAADAPSRAAIRISDAVREMGKPLVFGTITGLKGSRRNSMVMLGPDGLEAGRYDKRRLLAFGEYLPLSDTFPFLKGSIPGVGNMKEGESFGAFRIREFVASPSICYEAVHANFTREAVQDANADLIVNLTNDGWFGASGAPSQHLMVQVPRSVELRRSLVRSTMTGISAVVSPSGDIWAETGVYQRSAQVVTVPVPAMGSTPFAVYGPVFAWACVLATFGSLLAAAMNYRKGKKSRSTTTG